MIFTDEVKHFWNEFRMTRSDISAQTQYQTWYFGNTREMASELAELVLSDLKTATASSVAADAIEPEKAPITDGYSLVTDFEGRPLCIIQTKEIRYIPFNEVDAKFAFDEGEDDRSLESWRASHWQYFTREAEQHGFEFDEQSLVCCERFRRLFP